jgi:uncharacterized membrane protein (DUF485 family)
MGLKGDSRNKARLEARIIMKIQILKDKNIIYSEKTSKRFKGYKHFMWVVGLVFFIIGIIFISIIIFGSIWFGSPSTNSSGIFAGIAISLVGCGLILMGIIFFIRGYTILDLTIYNNGIVISYRPLKYILKNECDFIYFNDIERIYFNKSSLPSSVYLSKEHLLKHLPKFLPPSINKKINNGDLKAIKLRNGIHEPKTGDVIIQLKNGYYEIIEECDIEDRDSFKESLERFIPVFN